LYKDSIVRSYEYPIVHPYEHRIVSRGCAGLSLNQAAAVDVLSTRFGVCMAQLQVSRLVVAAFMLAGDVEMGTCDAADALLQWMW